MLTRPRREAGSCPRWSQCGSVMGRSAERDKGTNMGVTVGRIATQACLSFVVMLATVFTISVSGAHLAPAVAQSAPEAPRMEVEDIQVIGNRRIDAGTIINFLTFARGDLVSADDINESTRRLFDTGLFRNVSISPSPGLVVVRVDENPTVNRIAFEGNDRVTDEELQALIQTRPRGAFTRARAEADAGTLVELYRRTGRFGASVEPVIIERSDNRVDLVFEIEEGPLTGVSAITFVGNEAYSDSRLRGVIETRESGLFSWIRGTDNYDPDRLEFDKELLRRYYLDRGYADFSVLSATAELSPDREGFFITFTVEEGEIYNFGEIKIDSRVENVDPELFADLITREPGDLYEASVIDDTVEEIIQQAGKSGVVFIDVRPVAVRNEAERTIDVAFNIVPGQRLFVERIEIEGNLRTLDRVIRREFRFAEGDAFNAFEIERAERNIRGLRFFKDVNVRTSQGSAEDRAVVTVEVEEQSTGSVSFALGYSSSDSVLGEVNISERNLLGRGQFLRARLALTGDRQIVDLRFREPAFLGLDLSAGFDVFYIAEDNSDESSFEEKNIGFRPTVGFPIDEEQSVSFRWNIASDEIFGVDDDASPLIAADEGTALTTSLGYRYQFDRRNDLVEPSEGWIASIDQDLALLADAQYLRTVARGKAYTSFFDEELIASLELEGGGIFGFGYDPRITERFFLGGDSFRGFERSGVGPRDQFTDDALGGNIYAVLRSDVTFPLGLPEEFGIYGGVFSDIGTLFALDNTTYNDPVEGLVTIDDEANLRATVGVSLFWDSGFGPLRVNLATPLLEEDTDKTEFFRFTAGTRF